MRRFLLLSIFIFSVQFVNAQLIKRMKIQELNNFYTSGDSIYVINFWATFCKPCIVEIPYIESISQKYSGSKVKLLLVSLDVKTLFPSRLTAFAKKTKIKGDLAWLDESNADKFCPVIDSAWSGAIPATLIYNAKTGYKKFTEEQYKPAEFEAELKKAIGIK